MLVTFTSVWQSVNHLLNHRSNLALHKIFAINYLAINKQLFARLSVFQPVVDLILFNFPLLSLHTQRLLNLLI